MVKKSIFQKKRKIGIFQGKKGCSVIKTFRQRRVDYIVKNLRLGIDPLKYYQSLLEEAYPSVKDEVKEDFGKASYIFFSSPSELNERL